jgi:ParB/RepB/Spo0J family partition protein
VQIQLKLVPDTVERGDFRIVNVADLPDRLPGDPPDKAFLDSVRDFGIIQPIILTEGPNGIRVAAGRNRIKAARMIGIATLGAVVFPEGWVSTESLTLIENRHRRQNGLADMLAIEALLKSGKDEATIAANLGISQATIKGRMKLRNLVPVLAKALSDGKLFVTLALAICGMPAAEQEELAATYTKAGKVTLADVNAVLTKLRAAKVAAAAASSTPTAPTLAAVAVAQAVSEDAQIIADLSAKGWKVKVPTGKATLIEATHKTIGYTAATDYTKLAQNVETNETQWETYNSVKDWRQEKARQERMEWDERAAGLVQLLSDLIPAERLDLSAAIEGLEALLGPAAPKALPKVSKAPTV